MLDSKQAWDKLAVIYSTGFKMQIQQLRKQLKHLSCGNDSIDVYMRKVRSFFDQLSVLEGFVSEKNLVCDVLEGLGPDYRPFTRAPKACNSSLSFDELYALLLSEGTQLKFDSLNIASIVPPTAHYVKYGRGSTGCGRGSR